MDRIQLTLLRLPLEIRLDIFKFVVASIYGEANRIYQPSNEHLRILQLCRQIYRECSHLLWQYISLGTEREIRNFISLVDEEKAALVRYVDVANDGRMLLDTITSRKRPVSQLYMALRKITGLTHLRVFEARRGTAVITLPDRSSKVIVDPEGAMLWKEDGLSRLCLQGYELFLDSHSSINALVAIDPSRLKVLRLSGRCVLPEPLKLASLTSLSFDSVTGNYFDRLGIQRTLPLSTTPGLTSFYYAEASTMGYEIRDEHMLELVSQCSGTLRNLVLLWCSHLTSSAIASCLRRLDSLQYLAISFGAMRCLHPDLITSIPATLCALKLNVSNKRHWQAVSNEERDVCSAIEEHILTRQPPLTSLHIFLRPKLISEGWSQNWLTISQRFRSSFSLSPWDGEQEVKITRFHSILDT